MLERATAEEIAANHERVAAAIGQDVGGLYRLIAEGIVRAGHPSGPLSNSLATRTYTAHLRARIVELETLLEERPAAPDSFAARSDMDPAAARWFDRWSATLLGVLAHIPPELAACPTSAKAIDAIVERKAGSLAGALKRAARATRPPSSNH